MNNTKSRKNNASADFKCDCLYDGNPRTDLIQPLRGFHVPVPRVQYWIVIFDGSFAFFSRVVEIIPAEGTVPQKNYLV